MLLYIIWCSSEHIFQFTFTCNTYFTTRALYYSFILKSIIVFVNRIIVTLYVEYVLQVNINWKMYLDEHHIIIFCGNKLSGLYNHYHNWMWNEKCFQMNTILYFVAIYSPDYIITITVEIGSKNGARNIYIHVDLEKLPYMVSLITWSLNGHHHWIHIKKLILDIYNTSYILSM